MPAALQRPLHHRTHGRLLCQIDCRGPSTPAQVDNTIGWTFCCFYLGRLEEPEEHIFVGCTQRPAAQRSPVLDLDLS
ncbi:hypothetical protein Y695_04417 [Hydrogenophaga sp. T4]|nr:hypothetical protein Y695_04417 [Hydrogenophaga sp. T4]